MLRWNDVDGERRRGNYSGFLLFVSALSVVFVIDIRGILLE